MYMTEKNYDQSCEIMDILTIMGEYGSESMKQKCNHTYVRVTDLFPLQFFKIYTLA